MYTVVGVTFKEAGKIYYFDPKDIELVVGDNVIVETSRGTEFGEVVIPAHEVNEEEIVSPLKEVQRKVTSSDIKKKQKNEEDEEEAFDICLRKIKEHGLPMKLIDVEYTFDRNKVIFYFTADGRVDFRELVKDLAAIFKTRIELRQIGVRDEAKMVGGLGPCGRQLCCETMLRDFEPISIKMAKAQNLSLNPAKISGICGRLMCCLKYECDNYKKTKKEMPNVGDEVETDIGTGEITKLNVVKETVTVNLGDDDRIEVPVDEIDEVEENKD
ncbi:MULTISPECIES: PSP1 domain-containing protein [unclassified Candidatus Frackibacter]|uniref:PSP1 domain-containing protein n=1 Tax=unclassified Candidatus Frackibacter TaxID=2648818 RepID=UPI00087FA28B|nr:MULTISPECIES: stage 0 sporulation family protein [unclassified Candidatus Frackibacter]SDC54452.1 Cell fate regulator YaaT, PSP1 superfamily (controls sporulation, competence, biofilm development) [Candidatus Frackibacter sp. WG11]SEM66643.1 Cell fate regulator YaaT, PSP1 superfamily (controls sporulation, competence, biofilm development) [Candidatus Frackibacter sp. WG12]SFL77958.1 Cell fate regulator YaaT, PSP1 superfamily (controls sporulation, competence, biofilm development) [Candidatus 